MKTKNALGGISIALALHLGMLASSAQTNIYLFTGSETNITLAVGTYNITAYYENHGVTLRVAQTFQKGSQIGGLNQNSVPAAGLFSNDLRRWDFTSIFDVQKIFGIDHAPQITFDVVNFGNAVQRTYFQFNNAPYTEYKPGRQFMIGVRGNF